MSRHLLLVLLVLGPLRVVAQTNLDTLEAQTRRELQANLDILPTSPQAWPGSSSEVRQRIRFSGSAWETSNMLVFKHGATEFTMTSQQRMGGPRGRTHLGLGRVYDWGSLQMGSLRVARLSGIAWSHGKFRNPSEISTLFRDPGYQVTPTRSPSASGALPAIALVWTRVAASLVYLPGEAVWLWTHLRTLGMGTIRETAVWDGHGKSVESGLEAYLKLGTGKRSRDATLRLGVGSRGRFRMETALRAGNQFYRSSLVLFRYAPLPQAVCLRSLVPRSWLVTGAQGWKEEFRLLPGGKLRIIVEAGAHRKLYPHTVGESRVSTLKIVGQHHSTRNDLQILYRTVNISHRSTTPGPQGICGLDYERNQDSPAIRVRQGLRLRIGPHRIGWSFQQILRLGEPGSGSLQLGLVRFSVPSGLAPIYRYEPDLHWTYAIHALRGEGERLFVLVTMRPAQKIILEGKVLRRSDDQLHAQPWEVALQLSVVFQNPGE